jgi:hypothetical protein
VLPATPVIVVWPMHHLADGLLHLWLVVKPLTFLEILHLLSYTQM